MDIYESIFTSFTFEIEVSQSDMSIEFIILGQTATVICTLPLLHMKIIKICYKVKQIRT